MPNSTSGDGHDKETATIGPEVAPAASGIDDSKHFLLIVPLNVLADTLVPPLGIICLQSYAQQHGFRGEIIDFNTVFTEDSIDDYDRIVSERLRDWVNTNPNARLIGISVIFSGVFPRALRLAETIKRLDPKRIVALGGTHPTVHYQEILDHCPDIDRIVVGEGERAFVELLEEVYSADAEQFAAVADSAATQPRQPRGIPIFATSTNKRTVGELGLTDYNVIDLEAYHRPDMNDWYNPKGYPIICSAPVISTRSCPFDCNFCSVHAVNGPPKSFRYRPAADVIEEIRRVYYDHGIRYFRCSTTAPTPTRKQRWSSIPVSPSPSLTSRCGSLADCGQAPWTAS
jgi:anaerobic magnesium-protoporphyrin IX monomethyl ester cyclase